jgi:hypothetical protein
VGGPPSGTLGDEPFYALRILDREHQPRGPTHAQAWSLGLWWWRRRSELRMLGLLVLALPGFLCRNLLLRVSAAESDT